MLGSKSDATHFFFKALLYVGKCYIYITTNFYFRFVVE